MFNRLLNTPLISAVILDHGFFQAIQLACALLNVKKAIISLLGYMTLNKDTRMMPLKSFKKPRSKLATYYKTI